MSRRKCCNDGHRFTAGVALAACAPPAAPAGDSGGGAAPSEAQKEMSIATYADPRNEWQRVGRQGMGRGRTRMSI